MLKRVSKLLALCIIVSIPIASAMAAYAERGDVASDSRPACAPYVPDRILVKFKAGVSPMAMAQVNARCNAVEGEISRIGVQVVRVRPGEVAALIAAARNPSPITGEFQTTRCHLTSNRRSC